MTTGFFRQLFLPLLLTFTAVAIASAQDHRYDPPWNKPPESALQFTVAGVDNVPDLYGDINDPELVIFFAGNQFMCIDDLITAFKSSYPQYKKIFAETLPPGILARQIEGGSLVVGNMRITLKADVYTAGQLKIEQMKDLFSRTEVYAYNKLALMVAKGNPRHIQGLVDLGRNDIRVSMPNPEWEGIGKRILEAYRKAGGEALEKRIMEDKRRDATTFLTRIHHRETPLRVLYGQSDAGPVWYSEAYYQQLIGHPISLVEIPDRDNIKATYMAAELKDAPHPKAAQDFMEFLTSPRANSIYRKYGFTTD